MPFDFPAVNNITIAGYLPHDQVPSPGKLEGQLLLKNVLYFRSQEPIVHGGSLQVCETLPSLLPLHAIRRQLRWLPQVQLS